MGARIGTAAVIGMLIAGPAATGQAAGQSAGAATQGAAPTMRACSLLSVEEIKKIAGKHTPLTLGRSAPDEEPLSTGGAECSYGGIDVIVDPVPIAQFDANRARYGRSTRFEKVAGLGDEGYFTDQPGEQSARLLGIYARKGEHVVVVSLPVAPPDTAEALKPVVISLGKAAVAKVK